MNLFSMTAVFAAFAQSPPSGEPTTRLAYMAGQLVGTLFFVLVVAAIVIAVVQSSRRKPTPRRRYERDDRRPPDRDPRDHPRTTRRVDPNREDDERRHD